MQELKSPESAKELRSLFFNSLKNLSDDSKFKKFIADYNQKQNPWQRNIVSFSIGDDDKVLFQFNSLDTELSNVGEDISTPCAPFVFHEDDDYILASFEQKSRTGVFKNNSSNNPFDVFSRVLFGIVFYVLGYSDALLQLGSSRLLRSEWEMKYDHLFSSNFSNFIKDNLGEEEGVSYLVSGAEMADTFGEDFFKITSQGLCYFRRTPLNIADEKDLAILENSVSRERLIAAYDYSSDFGIPQNLKAFFEKKRGNTFFVRHQKGWTSKNLISKIMVDDVFEYLWHRLQFFKEDAATGSFGEIRSKLHSAKDTKFCWKDLINECRPHFSDDDVDLGSEFNELVLPYLLPQVRRKFSLFNRYRPWKTIPDYAEELFAVGAAAGRHSIYQESFEKTKRPWVNEVLYLGNMKGSHYVSQDVFDKENYFLEPIRDAIHGGEKFSAHTLILRSPYLGYQTRMVGSDQTASFGTFRDFSKWITDSLEEFLDTYPGMDTVETVVASPPWVEIGGNSWFELNSKNLKLVTRLLQDLENRTGKKCFVCSVSERRYGPPINESIVALSDMSEIIHNSSKFDLVSNASKVGISKGIRARNKPDGLEGMCVDALDTLKALEALTKPVQIETPDYGGL